MEQLTPTWHREALERGIDYIILVYHKADGFVFCPSNLLQPFRVEGDYDGSVPIDAVGALAYYERMLAPHNRKRSPDFTERVTWFVEFLQKILRHEDFSLDDLQLDRRAVEIRKGRWPW